MCAKAVSEAFLGDGRSRRSSDSADAPAAGAAFGVGPQSEGGNHFGRPALPAQLRHRDRCDDTGDFSLRHIVNRRLFQEREARLAVLDQALARGVEDEKAGRSKPLDDVVTRLERKYEGADRPAE